MKKTFKDAVLDLIYNAAFYEEGQLHDSGDIEHYHRMEMCEELAKEIEKMEEKNK